MMTLSYRGRMNSLWKRQRDKVTDSLLVIMSTLSYVHLQQLVERIQESIINLLSLVTKI